MNRRDFLAALSAAGLFPYSLCKNKQKENRPNLNAQPKIKNEDGQGGTLVTLRCASLEVGAVKSFSFPSFHKSVIGIQEDELNEVEFDLIQMCSFQELKTLIESGAMQKWIISLPEKQVWA